MGGLLITLLWIQALGAGPYGGHGARDQNGGRAGVLLALR